MLPHKGSAFFAARSIDDIFAELNTPGPDGIDNIEADKRRRISGPNELGDTEEETLLSKFIEQFKNPLILLLFGSAAISVLLGQIDDAVSITLAIVIVVTVAFVQEYRSEKSLEALNKLVPHYCHVRRSGTLVKLMANDLVAGDVVEFATGDRIPADIRLITAIDLEIDESSLTGENKPCKKHHQVIETYNEELPLAERKNIAFMGTLIRHGRGTGIVIGIGKDTEFGAVFKMMKEIETRKTPLQHQMDILGKQLSFLSIGVIVLIMLVGVFQGRPILEMFTIGVSLAVAAIPEGLPIVVTVTLALGVLRMASRHAIIKKLPSVESLGSVNVICVDKTGTLTMNKMTVAKLFTLAQDAVIDVSTAEFQKISQEQSCQVMFRIGVLCNNALIDEYNTSIGQPTEVALLEIARNVGFPDERRNFTRISEIPFSSDRKYMAVLAHTNGHNQETAYFVKGSFEAVVDMCTHYYVSHTDIRPFDANAKALIRIHSNSVSEQGLRCIFFAFGSSMDNLTFVGFVGMYDPPRPGVSDAISRLVGGGVKVVMITGDSDIICDGPVAQSLGVEAVDPDVMKKPPRSKEKSIISKPFIMRVLMSASVIVLGTMYMYAKEMKDGVPTQRGTTMACVYLNFLATLVC
ncbi:High affinity Ca2+/Mn2+ P-type ATPase-like protein [Chytridiales sp. JEL 0842]|nr:High affinity Ca2+/Mn2+ P-type ATPase-like protein [Chytridiales sp. JEL 0842]